VDHVQVAGRIEGHAVGGLPGEPVGQLRKVVSDAKPVLPFAEDGLVGEPPAAVEQAGDDVPTDEAGGPGDQCGAHARNEPMP
jgi:hypothetical protein